MPAKSKPAKPKWLVDIDNAEFAMDRAVQRVLKRDGRRIYRDASSDLLTMYAATIAYMDGGSSRLIRMLRSLAATHGRLEAACKKG
jgi:hypothetical protein